MMIFPPLLLVFSTDSAVLRPCSCFPRPWPSLKPYFCMILWATVPLWEHAGRKSSINIKADCPCFVIHHIRFQQNAACKEKLDTNHLFRDKTNVGSVCVCVCPTHPMLAKKELVGPGGERGRSESSYIGGGIAAFDPLAGRPSSS